MMWKEYKVGLEEVAVMVMDSSLWDNSIPLFELPIVYGWRVNKGDKMNYTKGIWETEGCFRMGDLYFTYVQSGDTHIAVVYSEDEGTCQSNAQLIAAAADTYEELKYAYDHILSFLENLEPNTIIEAVNIFSPQDKERMHSLRQALAKAEGK